MPGAVWPRRCKCKKRKLKGSLACDACLSLANNKDVIISACRFTHLLDVKNKVYASLFLDPKAFDEASTTIRNRRYFQHPKMRLAMVMHFPRLIDGLAP